MGFVKGFDTIDRTDVADVGGKGAQLGELSRVPDVPVPAGFCVTTEAFRQALTGGPAIDEHLDRLARTGADDAAALRATSAELRRAIEDVPLPANLTAEVAAALVELGPPSAAYAVRSSATAEDLPTASFAGQQDSFLNVVGTDEVLRHVRRCWASLFTERAVAYRQRAGFDHRKVQMAVVVQRMVAAEAAGVMFTADPVTSNRKVVTIEAVPGLAEALVAGLVRPDVYAVRDGALVSVALAGEHASLTEDQVVGLAELGRRIEAHFGHPQDIEWCLAGGGFEIVQSRPITTLFPIPATDDGENHVFVSVGHQQMMTDAMRPLGISLWQLTSPGPMHEAGGRLFVDVTRHLSTPVGREGLLRMLGRSDPLMGDALRTILEREGFVPTSTDDPGTPPLGTEPSTIGTDPAIVTELIERTDASVAAIAQQLRAASGTAVFDLIEADLEDRKRHVFDPRSLQVIMASVEATWWLNEHLEQWLGEKNAADVLAQSVPHNVTSEMGLALLDVADAIRPHPAVVAWLQQVADGAPSGGADFLDELAAVPGGREASDALRAYLERYGMRCAGEIDVTRTRWIECPALLVPAILSHVRNFAPGESRRRFAQGLHEYRLKKRALVARLRELPDGEEKVEQTLRMIERLRVYAGYREYPKYGMIGRYFAYKRALMQEAHRLVDAGALAAVEDVFFLRFEEFREAVRTGEVEYTAIERRRAEYGSYETLAAPRLITSDGEALNGRHRHDDLPAGALPGTPASAGVVEGRARVVKDIGQADLLAGDILVTSYTDPSWTPLFLSVDALVTEVGGQMTHGAVVAREYGLPAVVAVEGATRRIRDGQRIRVNGGAGYVELLD